MSRIHTIDVYGDFACFSRPELKVERWSYPLPTPGAARGIFDAIYCHKDEFRWEITRIEMLAQPRYVSLRRNEVKEKANVDAVARWMAETAEPVPIWADADKEMTGSDEKGRTQRQTMALAHVRYRLHGRILPWPGHARRQRAFDEQFIRRVKHGKCFQQPYLGVREFVAFFQEPEADRTPVAFDQELGWMLYDVFDLSRQNTSTSRPLISLFRASVRNGVLDVPPFDSSEVVKPLAQGA